MLLRDRARQWEAELKEREALQFQKGAAEGRKEGLRKGEQRGLRKGEQRGLRKGEAIGRQKALRSTLIGILEARFPTTPPGVVDDINAMVDEMKLETLTLKAATAPSIEDFCSALSSE